MRKWFDNWQKNNPSFKEAVSFDIPTATDDIHIETNLPTITILSPKQDDIVNMNSRLSIKISATGKFPIKKSELYINDRYISSSETDPSTLSFTPSDIGDIQPIRNTIKIISYDSVYNRAESTVNISISQ